MCRPITEGGRRCPIHQPVNHTLSRVISHTTGLTRYQTERLFSELRREGLTNPAPTEPEFYINAIRNEVEALKADNPELAAELERELEGADASQINGPTAYAHAIIRRRAAERAASLQSHFRSTAARLGYTEEELRHRYNETARLSLRGGQLRNDTELAERDTVRADAAGLPHDRASLAAFRSLDELGKEHRKLRIEHKLDPDVPGPNQVTVGYDEGRLELHQHSRTANGWNSVNLATYRNVPEGVYEEVTRRLAEKGALSASYYLQTQAQEAGDWHYNTPDEAGHDAYSYRCVSCGRFSAATGHECPQRAQRVELARRLAPTEVAAALADLQADEDLREWVANPESAAPPALPEPEPVTEAEVEAEAANPSATLPEWASGDMDNPALVGLVAADFGLKPKEKEIFEVAAAIGAEVFDQSRYEDPDFDPKKWTLETVRSFQEAGNRERLSEAYIHRSEFFAGNTDTPKGREFKKYREENPEVAALIDNLIENRGDAPTIELYFNKQVGGYDWQREEPSETPLRLVAVSSTRFFSNISSHWSSARTPLKATAPEEQAEVFAKKRDLEAARIATAVEEGKVGTASGTSTVLPATHPVKFGVASRPGSTETAMPVSIAPGRLNQIKAALDEKGAVTVPVFMKTRRETRYSGYVDSSGYGASWNAGTTITGNVTLVKNEDGTVSLASTRRQLKCDCYDYRRNYYCEHTAYAARNMASFYTELIAHESSVDRTTSGGTSGPRRRASHRLLTAALEDRGVAVVEDAEGNERISFVNATGTTSTYTRYMEDMVYNENWHQRVAGKTPEETSWNLSQESSVLSDFQHINRLERPAALKTALRRADVEVPVRAGLRWYSDSTTEIPGYRSRHNSEAVTGQLQGSIVLHQNEDGTTSIKSHTLKCECAEYAVNYDCRHVRVLVGHPEYWTQEEVVPGVTSRAARYSYDGGLRANNSTGVQLENGRTIGYNDVTRWINQNARAGQFMEFDSREAAIEAYRVQQNDFERNRAEREAEREREYRRQQREAMERREAEKIARNKDYLDAVEVHRASSIKRWENVEAPYSANPDSFYEDVAAAQKRKQSGEEPIPYRTENVLDGLSNPDDPAGRKFGIELEFDVKPGHNRRDVIAAVAQELYSEGLTENPYQTGYHTGQSTGWKKWSLEEDCTVAAELVSPLMDDSPESWNQLKKVCDIINKHGGVATTRTGGHVHVSSGSYASSTAKHAELVRTSIAHQDTLFRLAANPKRGSHRGTQWCRPNVDDRMSDITLDQNDGIYSLGNVSDHAGAMNFGASVNEDYKKSHVEFRMWDGSIDPAVIQQQVMVSVAMTDAAERAVVERGHSKHKDKKYKLGEGFNRVRANANKAELSEKERFFEDNKPAMELFDTLFRRKEDRASVASLFAITKWQAR